MHNNIVRNFLKNLSYALLSNLFSFLISISVSLFVPKIIGLKSYAYFQLYIFYSLYVGFMHFGWNDGIYLRYGGKQYSDLDKDVFFSQFYMQLFLQIFFAIAFYFFSKFLEIESEKKIIFYFVIICMVITNMRFMLLYTLQATNRIKEYAQIIFTGRFSYFISIFIILFFSNNFRFLIIADLFGRLTSFVYAILLTRDIVFQNIVKFKFTFIEAKNNILCGINIMFTNTIGMLTIGIIRLLIERSWDIIVFGQISLTLNIANLFVLFVNAVGVVIFPTLRRIDNSKLVDIYHSIRFIIFIFFFGVLVFYYPIYNVVLYWLPKYKDGLVFFSLLMPICVYESKVALLINTYYKNIRKEKELFHVNIVILLISVFISIFTIIVLHELTFAVLSITIIVMLKSIISELYLHRILKIKIYKNLFSELILTIGFILCSKFFSSWYITISYTLLYLLVAIFNSQEMKSSFLYLKRSVQGNA